MKPDITKYYKERQMLIGSTEQQLKEMEDYLRKNDAVEYAKSDSFKQHGFEIPSFAGEILKEIDGEYFGHVFDIEIARNVAIKWSSLGVVLTGGMNRFKLTPIRRPWYEVDTHYVMTKANTIGLNPIRKFKIAWTEEMKLGLESTGWRLATKAERDSLYVEEEKND